MSKIGASMNIFAVICRCHRQMTGNLSKKRKSSTGRSKRSGLPDAVNPDRASMSLCNGRFVAAAWQHMTRAIRGAFIKPEELFKALRKNSVSTQ